MCSVATIQAHSGRRILLQVLRIGLAFRRLRGEKACAAALLAALTQNAYVAQTPPGSTTQTPSSIGSQSSELPVPIVQSGHAGSINSLAFSTDRKLLATASTDGTIKIWEVSSGRTLATIQVSRGWVYSVAFSPDGKWLAAGSGDRNAYVFEVLTGRRLQAFPDHAGAVTFVTFSADGRYLASSCTGKVRLPGTSLVAVHELTSGRSVWSKSDGEAIGDVAFLSKAGLLAMVVGPRQIEFWDFQNNRLSVKAAASDAWTHSLLLSSDERLLAVSGLDAPHGYVGSVKIWDVSSKVISTAPRWVIHGAEALAFSNEGNQILGISTENWNTSEDPRTPWYEERKIGLWDIASGSEVRMLPQVALAKGRVSASTDGAALAISQGRTIQFSDVQTGRSTPSFAELSNAVRSLRFTADGKFLAAGLVSGKIVMWGAEAGQPTREFNGSLNQTTSVNGLQFTADGRSLFSSTADGSAMLWDLVSARPLRQLRAPDFTGDSPETLAHRSDDARLGTISEADFQGVPPPMHLMAVVDGEAPLPPPPPLIRLQTATVSSRGVLAYGGSKTANQKAVAFLTLQGQDGKGGELATTNSRPVTAAAFSPDGNTLAVGYVDGSTELWNVSARTLITGKQAHKGAVNEVEFAPDGTRFATADDDKTVKLWDARSGDELKTLAGEDRFLCVGFDHNSSLLAAGSADNRVTVWNLRSPDTQIVLQGHSSAVNALAFAPNGKVLVSGGEDATIRFWNVGTRQLLASATSFEHGNWIAFSPQGFFDGPRNAWELVPFSLPSAPFVLYEPEQFFNEFFQPGLLSDVFSRGSSTLETLQTQNDPRSKLDITRYLNSSPPKVCFVDPPTSPFSGQEIKLTVEAENRGSGLRDLRVFRNQSLVHFEHGDLKAGPNGVYRLVVAIKTVSGANEITAYAFDANNVKSQDAKVILQNDMPSRTHGTAYVVAVGINRYSNESFNLTYAEADAKAFLDGLKNSLTSLRFYDQVVTVSLVNEDATAANIRGIFERLTGSNVHGKPAAPVLELLQPTQPEDVVFFYFAGHGAARGDRYYLVPHDLGYAGQREALSDPGRVQILGNSVSDTDLEAALEKLDASHVMLILDACYSGQILEAQERRRGPMNSRGLAQLAYEKGAFVLAAAQSYQTAREFTKLGHGLLTYVLMEKGLQDREADEDPKDGQITAGKWLRFATQQVPIEFSAMQGVSRADGRPIEVTPLADGVQAPRSFFRRDVGDSWILRKQ